MHRSHLLISGDPISLARGAAQIKAALEAELAFYALSDEVAVEFTGSRFFRNEFAAHAEKMCPTGVCTMRGEPILEKQSARNSMREKV